jgi:transcription-repair coupling factor (superfamily II helicase)
MGKNQARSTAHFSGLSLPALAYLLPEIAREGKELRALLLTADESGAEHLFRDLEFYSAFRAAEWKETELHYLPGWEQSPYRNLQPSLSDRFERIRVSHRLMSQNGSWVVVASLPAFLQAAADPAFLAESFPLKKGMTIPPEELCRKLEHFGYSPADSVEDPGTYSLRGGILDLFAPSSDHPVRIEFIDEEIESLRLFNPETQRSVRILSENDSVEVIPAREFACDPENLLAARERFKEWCDQQDFPRTARERIGTLLGQGIVTPEMDYLLPFFREKQSWIPDLAQNASLILVEPEKIKQQFEEWESKQEELFQASLARQNAVPEPSRLHQNLSAAIEAKGWAKIAEARELALGDQAPRSARIRLSAKKKSADVDGLIKKLGALRNAGLNAVLVANSQSQLDRLLFLLNQHKVRSLAVKAESDLPKDPSFVSLILGTLSESFELPEKSVAFLSEDEIFGEKKHIPREKKRSSAPPVVVEDLQVGDLVVHTLHGIGKYLGLSRVKALNSEGDFALVEYSEGDKLYVPVYRLESLSRYVGTAGASSAHLDKLGSGSFAKTKEKVKAAVKDIAQDLLRVQAERTTKEGFAYSAPDDEYRNFESEFPYDETPDQEKAIRDTLDDMQAPQPMDRLVCGDVGFGKTEVAIRAAFKAAQDGKQVAVLVPTTILAEQHYLTFSARMANYPVKIASLSRFKSRKEQAATVQEVEEGKVDILIGTHRLLSKDIKFKDLGLLIIDEEQRFGVEHKEKLKAMRATTDVLTLTATPIPRTLQMSLMGLKDVSIIRTPPGDRLTIKTHLATFDEEIIRNAIRTELGRGGQVFFIHNRVQTITKIANLVEQLVPEAKTVVAHGQMPESQLERAMIGFYQKQFDVLIATAIIENGLDVPNANTLIVDRADTFGLSQLYQIRGRVGRSQTRAYAYFLMPETAVVTDEARERLAVLQRFVELGSGYTIATHDLEIRGGGDVLGQAQSGHIASVGYEMYLELLHAEIHRLKGEKVAAPQEEVEINVPFSALLPQDYVPDMKSRLIMYRRLSAVATEEDAASARQELEDRYGPLPTETGELLWILRLKVLMRRMGLKALTLGPKGISLTPGPDPVLNPTLIMALVHNYPKEYSILPEGKFVIRGAFNSGSQVYDKLRQILSNSMQ